MTARAFRRVWLYAAPAVAVLAARTTTAVGLATTSTTFNFPPTLAVLGGVGVSIPIGNRGEPTQAAVNLHAWLAYELRSDYTYPNGSGVPVTASHWSFLFGPSITIGNIGTNL